METREGTAYRVADDTREMVTLVRRADSSPAEQRVSAFPSDLFEQARGRLRLLAALFFCGFMFDVVMFVITVIASDAPPLTARSTVFQQLFLGAAIMSAIVWWAAKSPRFSASRIHTLGLMYEVAVCAVSAGATYWIAYRDTGVIPNLTWVPAVVIM